MVVDDACPTINPVMPVLCQPWVLHKEDRFFYPNESLARYRIY